MKKSIAIALAFAAGGLFAGNEASKVPMIVYRGELFDAGTGKAPAGGPNMTRAMRFSFYDTGASGAKSLCSCELKSVPINPDGSFEAILGPDGLPGLVVSGLVTHVGLRIGTTPQSGVAVTDYAEELSPRRELRPLVGANRALVAEAGASDMCIGVLAADALAAGRLVVNDAEVSGPVLAPDCEDAIEVNPVTLHEKERTTLLKGRGVTVWGGSPKVIRAGGDCAQRGVLCNAPADGVALVHTPDSLAIPGVVQFYRKGDAIRSPISASGVRVTFWEFAKGGDAQ